MASLVALLLGFACNAAGTLTTTLEARFGRRLGRGVTVLLRDVLGIPLWAFGLAGAIASPAPALFHLGHGARAAAGFLIGTGAIVIAWALIHLRLRAMAPTVDDRLEAGGPYAFVRHPILSGVFLQLPGILLLWPTTAVAVACALTLAWLPAQAWLEERDLVRRMPEYAEYARRVPPFFPGISRGAAERGSFPHRARSPGVARLDVIRRRQTTWLSPVPRIDKRRYARARPPTTAVLEWMRDGGRLTDRSHRLNGGRITGQQPPGEGNRERKGQMLPSSSLFDTWISRPKRPWVGVIFAVLLLVAPFLVAWLEGHMSWLIETGRWRSILVAPTIIIYVLAVAPRQAALEARVYESLRPLLVDEQAGIKRLARVAGGMSVGKEVAAFLVGAALGVAMSREGLRNEFSWLEMILVVEQGLMYGLMGVVVYGSLASTRVTSTLLGMDLKIDPLDVSPFVAIGRQSLWMALIFVGGITLSLLFIGMQPEYLLLWEFWLVYGPLIVVPVVVFFLNMAPTHRRLQAARDAELRRVEALIRQECSAMVRELEAGDEPTGAEGRITALTAYESRLQQARTWPYNTAMLRTVFVSVLIPGGTMVGRVVAELARR